jgi:hypothetical protein
MRIRVYLVVQNTSLGGERQEFKLLIQVGKLKLFKMTLKKAFHIGAAERFSEMSLQEREKEPQGVFGFSSASTNAAP